MENQSKYDPTRKTVGAIYRDAQLNNREESVINGDLTKELTTSLITDLNDCITSNPFEGRDFYITIHEKKDLQMNKAILRRLIRTEYRPWPEDDTVVFWTSPSKNLTKFCWCLPHHTEMPNVLANPDFFEPEYFKQVRAWHLFELEQFGFMKDPMGNWIANPKFEDKPLVENKVKILIG